MLALIAAFSFSEFFSAVVVFENQHWQGQVATLILIAPSITVALNPYPKLAGLWATILKILNPLSILSHKDSPNTLKAPFTQSQPPAVVGSQVSPGAGKPAGFAIVPFMLLVAVAAILATALVLPAAPGTAAVPVILAALGLALVVLLAVVLVSRKAETWREWKHRTGHFLLPVLLVASLGAAAPAKASGITWGQPVFYAGPSLAFTELNLKTGGISSVGAGVCFQATGGFGQYEMLNLEWDVFDVSGMGCGSTVAGGSLQVGGKLGTLNGLFGIAVLKPFSSDGTSLTPVPGVTAAAVIDVQGIIAFIGSITDKLTGRRLKLDGTARAARGGLHF